MNDSSVPKPEGLASPAPPFTPVQVMSSLPPAAIGASSRSVSLATMTAQQVEAEFRVVKRPNPTGLSRAEIRLLADAVAEANDWRGTLVGNPDPEPLARFDAQIAKMKAAIRKLKAASGYNFSGRKKK